MLMLAVQRHAGQYDKAGQPYILHPLRVMGYVMELPYVDPEDEDIRCIAVGHDLKEDCNVTDDEFRFHGQSERTIVGIDHLTKRDDETYEMKVARICSNRDSMIAKLGDLRDNSDLRRIKGVTEKDLRRVVEYHRMYKEITDRLKA